LADDRDRADGQGACAFSDGWHHIRLDIAEAILQGAILPGSNTGLMA
jgi:hypothetical protein